MISKDNPYGLAFGVAVCGLCGLINGPPPQFVKDDDREGEKPDAKQQTEEKQGAE